MSAGVLTIRKMGVVSRLVTTVITTAKRAVSLMATAT